MPLSTMTISSALPQSSSPRLFTVPVSPKTTSNTRGRPQLWIVFTIGFCCGHFHAVVSNNASLWCNRERLADGGMMGPRCFQEAAYSQSFSQDDGSVLLGGSQSADLASFSTSHPSWNSIHVYVGPPASSETIAPTQNQRWFSQARQDELVIGLLRNKTNGYFVDLAANDAMTLSNTYALERDYDWNGLCIEANTDYWYNLSTMRTGCHIVGAVVGNRTGDPVHFRFDNGDHGGIVGFDNGPRWRSHAKKRTTVTLLDIVNKFESPAAMDYLSLDVEGAETFVLGNFPLDRFTFRIITAERLRGEIRHYLIQHGFRFVQKLTRWGESLWINQAFEDELDLSVLDQFGFPLF